MKSIVNNSAKNCATQVGAVAKVYGVITFSCFSGFKYNYILVEGIIFNHKGSLAHIVSYNSCFKQSLQKTYDF